MRTPKPSRSGATRDLTLLTRALARAEADQARPRERREALCAHLRQAIHILSEESPGKKRTPSSTPAEV